MTTEERLAKVERELAELRAKLLGVAELLNSQRKLPERMRPITKPPTDARVVGLTDSWTFEHPVAYFFRGQRYEVKIWKGILLGICGTLADVRRADFERVLSLPGFSRDQWNLGKKSEPRKIAGSDIYVATTLAANGVRDKCREMMDLFGYSVRELKIELRGPGPGQKERNL